MSRIARLAAGTAAGTLIASALVYGTAAGDESEPRQDPTLQEAAAQSGRFAGAGITASEIQLPEYAEIAGSEFGSITPGNEMKWGSVEPAQGQFDWSGADQLVEFAESNGQEVHGHTLVWHSQLPGWVENGQYEGELSDIMTDHITTEVSRYAGQIARWDVVNEPFNEDGTMRDSVFLQEIGESYIADAFRAADAADPDAKLYINDYNTEGMGAKSDAMYELVSSLLDQGVPIDGVGFQSHFIVGQVPADMRENLQRFADLGLEVAVTELDVRIEMPADDAELEQQATDYASVVGACTGVAGCTGVTIWGITDAYSWIPDVFPGYGAALAWDENYQPKPAYGATREAFTAAAATS
jgi:endo-1,4-beta-xylanase